MKRTEPKSLGYSFVELLIAMTLTATLAGMAVPRLPAFYEQYQLTNAGRQLAFDLVRSRARTIGEAKEHRLQFGSQGYHVQVNNAGNWVNDGAAISLPKGTSFATVPTAVSFTTLGLLTSPASLTVSSGGKQVTVRINELGKVTVGTQVTVQ